MMGQAYITRRGGGSVLSASGTTTVTPTGSRGSFKTFTVTGLSFQPDFITIQAQQSGRSYCGLTAKYVGSKAEHFDLVASSNGYQYVKNAVPTSDGFTYQICVDSTDGGSTYITYNITWYAWKVG